MVHDPMSVGQLGIRWLVVRVARKIENKWSCLDTSFHVVIITRMLFSLYRVQISQFHVKNLYSYTAYIMKTTLQFYIVVGAALLFYDHMFINNVPLPTFSYISRVFPSKLWRSDAKSIRCGSSRSERLLDVCQPSKTIISSGHNIQVFSAWRQNRWPGYVGWRLRREVIAEGWCELFRLTPS